MVPQRFLLVLFAATLAASFSSCTDSSSSNEESQIREVEEVVRVAEEISNQVVNDFLWKPGSERDGNLVVLVNPVGVRIEVSGVISETLVDSGPSNGRGTTGRSSVPGYRFGDQVKVEFFDSRNRRIRVADGSNFVLVPEGRNRFQFRL